MIAEAPIQPEDLTGWEYQCPVCGIQLAKSNFDTPERDYFCPYCTSRQLPSRQFARPT